MIPRPRYPRRIYIHIHDNDPSVTTSSITTVHPPSLPLRRRRHHHQPRR